MDYLIVVVMRMNPQRPIILVVKARSPEYLYVREAVFHNSDSTAGLGIKQEWLDETQIFLSYPISYNHIMIIND